MIRQETPSPLNRNRMASNDYGVGIVAMVNTLYLPELREMIAEDNGPQLREFCEALHPARTAEFMEGLTADESWRVIRHADLPLREQIFSYFDHDKQIEIIEQQDRDEVAELVAELASDDRVDLLELVSPKIVAELLKLLPADERRDILRLRAFPDGTAGAEMTSQFAKLSENLTAPEALQQLASQSADLETIYYLYVVNETDHLRGVVSTRQLVSALSKVNLRLGDLMDTDIVTVNAMDDQELVAQKVAKYDLLAIPVVDNEHRMLGIITHDDVIDIMREEATEDAHRIAAVEPLEEGYLQISLLQLSWNRGMWLTILFIAALLTALVLGVYDEILAENTWLMLFVPLVISSGGNSGSQSATLVITAMATGEISLRDWAQIIRREIMMGVMLGTFLAMLGFVATFFMSAPSMGYVWVVTLTLLLVVVCGTITGASLPLLFRRMGLDPALMSNPFVAGIADILGIVIYLNVFKLIMLGQGN